MMRKYLFLWLIILFSLPTCSRSDENLPQLVFEVKQELLGQPFIIHELGIAFYPPKAWQLIDKKKMNILKEKLPHTNSPISPVPQAVFFVFLKENGACAVISTFSTPVRAQKLNDFYQMVLRKKYSNLKATTYRYKEFVIYQYLFMDKGRVVFKLLVVPDKDKLFQIDYIVPFTVYKQEVKGIESSIGSLTKISP